jgi:EAL domain-containing protein (putative c-di-GMP-specific phosphodiesterase class I)
VLRRACADATEMPDDIKVAVNLSPAQLRNADIVDIVSHALSSSGLNPSRLELEITETALLKNNETTVALLLQLRAFGLRIALDDFGTGYSSLSYLRSFPFDKIKIDQSFIRELQAGNNSGAIVDAITAMARSLDMRTVAEGVETMEQLQLVRAAGCTEAQGYLFSRPRPSGELAALLAGNPTAPLD